MSGYSGTLCIWVKFNRFMNKTLEELVKHFQKKSSKGLLNGLTKSVICLCLVIYAVPRKRTCLLQKNKCECDQIRIIFRICWYLLHKSSRNILILSVVNPLSASVALIQKPVNWFVLQINWLVSIWGQHWHLMGLNITIYYLAAKIWNDLEVALIFRKRFRNILPHLELW